MKILFHKPTGTTKTYPRADDEPVIGLSAEYEVFDLIDSTRPSHNSATHYVRRLPEVIDQTTKTVTRGWEVVAREVPAPEPIVVKMASFRKAIGYDLEVKISAAILALEDPVQKRNAKIDWEYEPYVSRAHPSVTFFAAIIGKTSEEVDALFAAAKQLEQPAT